jgi:hypothetical protein
LKPKVDFKGLLVQLQLQVRVGQEQVFGPMI